MNPGGQPLEPGRGTPHPAHLSPGHVSAEDLFELALAAEAGRIAPESSAGEAGPAAPVKSSGEEAPLAQRWKEALACGECAPVLRRASLEVRALRSLALAIPEPDSSSVERTVRGALASTLGEDLSWRGDWRVVSRFLGERLRTSRVLRLVAASLLLHLLALPVIGFVLLRRAQENHGVSLWVETPSRELAPAAAPVAEPRRELERSPAPEAPGPLSYAIEIAPHPTRLAAARRELLGPGTPAPRGAAGGPRPEATGRATPQAGATSEPASQAARILEARARRLSLGGLDSTLRAPSAGAPLFLRALWAELLLDDWILSGQPDGRLRPALEALVSERTAQDSSAELALARLALDRASAAGALIPGVALPQDPTGPLSQEWFRTLESALGGITEQDPSGTLAAWMAWGRQRAR
ncbi:MAG: hypothetical protein IPK67_08405 [Planctomycetes bacterium]|nr:hypothetical protein [Planctomycetota bacterium]